MFRQVMGGRVDQERLKAQLAASMSDLAPGAEGWPGTTAGETADGRFIAVVRFESQDAVKANGTSLMQVDRYVDLPNPMLYSR